MRREAWPSRCDPERDAEPGPQRPPRRVALHELRARAFHLVVPTPRSRASGAGAFYRGVLALAGLEPALAALGGSGPGRRPDVEGLMHARETPAILEAGARILHVSNEHPEALERLPARPGAGGRVRRGGRRRLRGRRSDDRHLGRGHRPHDRPAAGAPVGVWGWTTRAGTLRIGPAASCSRSRRAGRWTARSCSIAATSNLTFKRYLEAPGPPDHRARSRRPVEGDGTDAALMRGYLEAWGERNAYAVSHVGWGLEPAGALRGADHVRPARHERHGAARRGGNFLFSTGANEFAGRHTAGHFDLPVMRTTIELDGDDRRPRRRGSSSA